MVKQISVFVENRKGRLAELTKQLRENDIDLKALTIADTTSFGILRCIVNNPEKAIEVIKKAGFTANITEVLAVKVPDSPGGLAKILDHMADADISVEYLYSFVYTHDESALIIFRVEDPVLAKETLTAKGVCILDAKDVYAL